MWCVGSGVSGDNVPAGIGSNNGEACMYMTMNMNTRYTYSFGYRANKYEIPMCNTAHYFKWKFLNNASHSRTNFRSRLLLINIHFTH